MTRKSYETDLTDRQWKELEPLIPPAKPGGRPRTQDMREVVNAIHQGAKTALSAPDVLERLRVTGNEALGSTPAEFEQRFKADLVKFAKIVKDAHIPVQD